MYEEIEGSEMSRTAAAHIAPMLSRLIGNAKVRGSRVVFRPDAEHGMYLDVRCVLIAKRRTFKRAAKASSARHLRLVR